MFITIGSLLLSAVFTWFGVAIWFVEFVEQVPFETTIRLLLCIAFSCLALILIRTARRGYTKTRLREILLELLSGGF